MQCMCELSSNVDFIGQDEVACAVADSSMEDLTMLESGSEKRGYFIKALASIRFVQILCF